MVGREIKRTVTERKADRQKCRKRDRGRAERGRERWGLREREQER